MLWADRLRQLPTHLGSDLVVAVGHRLEARAPGRARESSTVSRYALAVTAVLAPVLIGSISAGWRLLHCRTR